MTRLEVGALIVLCILAVVFIAGFIVGYVALWMGVICWILAQWGYTFHGWNLLVPFGMMIIAHIILGAIGGHRESRKEKSE